PQGAQEPGPQDGEDVGGLHGLGVVEAVQDLHLPAEGFEVGAAVDDRVGHAHADPAPALVVGDLVGRADEAEAGAADLGLGGRGVDGLQVPVGGDGLGGGGR